MEFYGNKERKIALVIDKKDNVGVALADFAFGETCFIIEEGNEYQVVLTEPIKFGHKFALKDLQTGEPVIKYGEEIGEMISFIQKGGWIHNHNMSCEMGLKP
jgi:hypothetical protein